MIDEERENPPDERLARMLAESSGDIAPMPEVRVRAFPGTFDMIVLIVIFTVLACMAIRHFAARHPEHGPMMEEQVHPLLYGGEDDVNMDQDYPAEAYNIMRDLPELESDHEIWKSRFNKSLIEPEDDPEALERARNLKMRDDFAAQRLELLRRIEKGEVRPETDGKLPEVQGDVP